MPECPHCGMCTEAPVENMSEEPKNPNYAGIALKTAKNCHRVKSTAACMCIIAATQLVEEGAVEAMTDLQKMNFAMLMMRMSESMKKYT